MPPITFRALAFGDVDAIHRRRGGPATNAHDPLGANADREASHAMLDDWIADAARDGLGYELALLDGERAGAA